MFAEVDQFKLGGYTFLVTLDTGAGFGGEITVKAFQGETVILSRTFYFLLDAEGRMESSHIRSFAAKFVRDAAYRETCIQGMSKWARVADWYDRNEYYYGDKLQTFRIANMRDKKELAKMHEQAEAAKRELMRLYKLIESHIDEWEALPAYQEHRTREALLPKPSMAILDPEIVEAVHSFNQVPGVETKFSCQGLRNGMTVPEWPHGPIWFPGLHECLAYIQFAFITPSFAADLSTYLMQTGIGVWDKVVRRARADVPEHNAKFIAACQAFACRAAANRPY